MFSPRETKILKLLGKKKLSIRVLSEKYYEDEACPINPGNLIAGAISRINAKCTYNKLDWFIQGEGLGRGGKIVWVESL
jgi:hypothetical protein